MRPVPVFMYHHINTHKGDMVTVTPDIFEIQMRYLHETGYRTLKAHELVSYIQGNLAMKDKAVMITFDDGWLDNYLYAFPILKKYKINASIFIVTNWVDNASSQDFSNITTVPTHEESAFLVKQNREHEVVLNWGLIDEMEGSGLVEFHSHTQNHVKCHQLSEQDLSIELRDSKETIKKRLASDNHYLCWPMGRYNDVTIGTAKKLGYSALFTTDHGIVNSSSDPWEIARIAAKNSSLWFRKAVTIYTSGILSKLYLSIKKR